MTSVSSIMNKPISIDGTATVYDAIKELLTMKISRFLVSDGKNYTSILTEKDIGMFLLNDKTERNLEKIPISEIIKPLQSIDSSTSIKDCAKLLIGNAIGSVAVVSDGSVNGIVTKTDLVRYYAENFAGKKTVGEYTTWYFAWSYSDTPIHKIVKKMLDEKISRVILRNHNELPEGILAFRDLFRVSLGQGNLEKIVDNTDPLVSVSFTRKGFLSESGFGANITANQIMTDKIIAVNYDDDLAQACNTMLGNKINAVGVLSSRGNIIGILSKTDVTRALVFSN